MGIESKTLVYRYFIVSILISIMAASLVFSHATQTSEKWVRFHEGSHRRHPKTMDMTMGMKGMNLLKQMIQNGVPFRPVPPPFPALKNLFKVNGTSVSFVPLGSLIIQKYTNGKIIST